MSESLPHTAPNCVPNKPPTTNPAELDRYAPVDEFGMPYPIHPALPENVISQMPDNYDHAFYERNNPALTTPHGRILSMSRVYLTNYVLHSRKHARFPRGIRSYPETEQDAFGLLMLACGGYLPKEGLDLSKAGECTLRTMRPDEYEWKRSHKRMHVELRKCARLPFGGPYYHKNQNGARRDIGEYIVDYAKRQDIDDVVDDKMVDELLHTKDPVRQKVLAKEIIKLGIEECALETVRPLYAQAFDKGLLPPTVSSPVEVVRTLPMVGPWGRHARDLQLKFAA